MIRKREIAFIVSLVLLLSTYESSGSWKGLEPLMNKKLQEAHTKFSINLFLKTVEQDLGKNTFLSPLSINIALAMVLNGAKGGSREAIQKVLELKGIDLETLNETYLSWQESFKTTHSETQVLFANSLWAQKGIVLSPDFEKKGESFYHAQMEGLDFTNPASLQTINAWVKKKTEGKMDQIVSHLQPDDLLVLINALYFKGAWLEPFEALQTAERPFYLYGGGVRQKPFMRRIAEYYYFEEKDFQAIRLPYKGGRVGLYLFLPSKESTLNTFYQSLSLDNWNPWFHRFKECEGTLLLPKIRMDYAAELNPVLKALGMEEAFDKNKANFEDMLLPPSRAFLSKVIHKTYLEWDENGTEAAATTAVMMAAKGAPPSKPFVMTIDRPFFFVLRDDVTGVNLFLGSVLEP